MERLKNKILYSALGASGGMAGLVYAGRCSGTACTSCLGCALPVAGILLVKLFQELMERRKNNGMA